jgi:hypothetical protein
VGGGCLRASSGVTASCCNVHNFCYICTVVLPDGDGQSLILYNKGGLSKFEMQHLRQVPSIVTIPRSTIRSIRIQDHYSSINFPNLRQYLYP